MEPNKAEVIDQIRELNMLLIQSKLHVGRSRLMQGRLAGRVGDNGDHTLAAGAEERPAGSDDSLCPADMRALHGQGRLLGVLGLRPEMNQRDLGYLLGMSRQAVGELLAKLEQKGFVSRKASDQDRRTLVVRLTDQGKQAAQRMREGIESSGDILDCLNEQELAQFSGYLTRIIHNAESSTAVGDEFAERRKAMREFLSLSHQTPDDGRNA